MDEQKIFKRDMPQDMANAALGKGATKQPRLDELMGQIGHLHDRCRAAAAQLYDIRARMYGPWPEADTEAEKQPEPAGTVDYLFDEVRRIDQTINRIMEHIQELKEL